MSNHRVMVLLVLGLGNGASACGGSMSRGISAYHAGSYPEALVHMTAAQRDAAELSQPQQARYALYRGLVHLGLGDRESADLWLAGAKALWDSNRFLLDQRDRGRLLSAWDALGHSAGEWGVDILRRRGARD